MAILSRHTLTTFLPEVPHACYLTFQLAIIVSPGVCFTSCPLLLAWKIHRRLSLPHSRYLSNILNIEAFSDEVVEMTQRAKMLAIKSDAVSSIPQTHMVELISTMAL